MYQLVNEVKCRNRGGNKESTLFVCWRGLVEMGGV